MARSFLRTLALCAALSAVLWVPVALAQSDGIFSVNRIRNATPKCADHPQYEWVGRVSGSTDSLLDRPMPVSFVGCFPTERECERWLGQASSIITTTLIQYSCKPR
ncbi:MAG: hypothetical protein ROR55_13765 [Devosia sp.]